MTLRELKKKKKKFIKNVRKRGKEKETVYILHNMTKSRATTKKKVKMNCLKSSFFVVVVVVLLVVCWLACRVICLYKCIHICMYISISAFSDDVRGGFFMLSWRFFIRQTKKKSVEAGEGHVALLPCLLVSAAIWPTKTKERGKKMKLMALVTSTLFLLLLHLLFFFFLIPFHFSSFSRAS